MVNHDKGSKTVESISRFSKEKKKKKNSESGQIPSFHYEYIESKTGEQNLNAAFDILFREVFEELVDKYD